MLLFHVLFPKLFLKREIFYYFKTIPSRRSPFCCSSLLHSPYSALCVHCHTPGRGRCHHPFRRPRPLHFHLAAAPVARWHPLHPKSVFVAFLNTNAIGSPALTGTGRARARGSPRQPSPVGLRPQHGAGAGAALAPSGRVSAAVAAVPP